MIMRPHEASLLSYCSRARFLTLCLLLLPILSFISHSGTVYANPDYALQDFINIAAPATSFEANDEDADLSPDSAAILAATPTPSETATSWEWTFPCACCDGWTSVTIPCPQRPLFYCTANGLMTVSLTNTNTFGYWKSPDDVVPIDPDYLYRARFNIFTDVSVQSRVPQIRVRVNSLNLQQFDYITVESTGDGGASPVPAGTDYDLYFLPPANDSWLVLSFDLLNFNPEDEDIAGVVLSYVAVERYPLSSLSAPTLLQTYTFDTSTEGWTTFEAPMVFTPPYYDYFAGALELESVDDTNTFGYWQSDAADITVEADRLYRGTFEVRTDVTDRNRVPQMRLRFNTENLQVSRTLGFESIGDGANSPGTTNTIYDKLYFLPPTNCVGGGLMVSFDLLNFFWPYDYGNLILDSATVESLSPPASP